jgi:hypothetical protein
MIKGYEVDMRCFARLEASCMQRQRKRLTHKAVIRQLSKVAQFARAIDNIFWVSHSGRLLKY